MLRKQPQPGPPDRPAAEAGLRTAAYTFEAPFFSSVSTIDLPMPTCIELMTPPAPVITPQPSGPRSSRGASASTMTTLRSRHKEWLAKDDWC